MLLIAYLVCCWFVCRFLGPELSLGLDFIFWLIVIDEVGLKLVRVCWISDVGVWKYLWVSGF